MGQVPKKPDKISQPLLILGSGKLARHLAHYFDLLSIPFIQWARRDPPERSLQKLIQEHAPRAALLLIQDSAIEAFIGSHPELRNTPLVHCSGCLSTSLATGMHPLMTFGPNLYEPHVYPTIPFIVEAGGLEFSEIFPELQNPFHKISPQEKPFYHALCVLSGNFSVILWQKLFREFENRLKIPSQAAQPYLEQMTRNLIHSPHGALTGPLQRRDLETIEKNLEALSGDSFQTIYQAFREITL